VAAIALSSLGLGSPRETGSAWSGVGFGHKGRAGPGGNRIPVFEPALAHKTFESWTPAVLSNEQSGCFESAWVTVAWGSTWHKRRSRGSNNRPRRPLFENFEANPRIEYGFDLQECEGDRHQVKSVSKSYRKDLDSGVLRPVYSEPRPPAVTKSLRPVSSVYRRTQMPRKRTQTNGYPSCLRRRGRQDALARRFSGPSDRVGRYYGR
jgi:hypothetical protein